MKTIEEQIAVMTAFKDGEDVEFRCKEDTMWIDATTPAWSWDRIDYRIKPKEFELKYVEDDTIFVGSTGIGLWYDGTNKDYIDHGKYRVTEEHAEKSLERNKRANRLEALVEQVSIELGMIDWEADWNDLDRKKHYICYGNNITEWIHSYDFAIKRPEVVYMPKAVAYRVCEVLNNKEYEL